MQRTRLLSLVLALVLCLTLAVGCAAAKGSTASPSSTPAEISSALPVSGDGQGTGISLTDMKGREVTLEAPATRVVALTAADAEILYALDAGDTLVGRGEYCDYPEAVLAVEAVASGGATNLEQIIALKPQILFMNTMAQTQEQVQRLEEAGIQVLVSEATDVNGIYTAIDMIGRAVGKGAQAAALIDGMRADLAALEAEIPTEETARNIYFEISPLEYGLWTAGSDTFMDELAGILGLRNAFGDVAGWADISAEQVIERNPDYIVSTTLYMGEGPLPEEEIKARAGWGTIAAVQNGTVWRVNGDELSRPGPRLVLAAQNLYTLIYKNAAA